MAERGANNFTLVGSHPNFHTQTTTSACFQSEEWLIGRQQTYALQLQERDSWTEQSWLWLQSKNRKVEAAKHSPCWI